jgi:DNA-binding winged helix-turn-helix (wHTH) protein/tetratricopeptide (TPR) repeat protein
VSVLKLADLAMREDFSLGPLEVSPALRLVKGPAGEVHVEPLTMQVFLALVDAKGQVVTRNYLYDECWGGVNVGDYSLNRAITMVRRIAAESAPGAFVIESIPRTGYRLLVDAAADGAPASFRWRTRALIGAGVLLVLAAPAWFFLDGKPHEPSAVIEASGPRSAELASGISSAAMTAAATYQTPLRIFDVAGARADFVLKVGERQEGNARKIDLALVSGDDKALLWTWSAARPVEAAAALDPAARDIGSQALACAAETRADNASPDEETVRLYVDACARFGPWFSADLKLLTDDFERVTARAPRMRGAWSKLFLSKAEAIEGYPPVDLADSLKQDLNNSLSQRIEVPESYIAKAAILPLNARFERLQLYEAGLARYPGNPFLLSARSWQLRSLGRMDEAARTAQRLAVLYPDSSAASTEFANSLMHSGRYVQARNVLARAEKLSPDAPNLRSARWRLEMRYGDPRAALRMAQGGERVVDPPMVKFLEARIDPSRAKVDGALDALMGAYRADPREPGPVAQALGAFGRNDEAIRFLLAWPGGATAGDGAEMLFRPPMREVRRDPRFMRIARNFGVTDYWRRSGILPDFCYEPGLPYDCRRELARIAD